MRGIKAYVLPLFVCGSLDNLVARGIPLAIGEGYFVYENPSAFTAAFQVVSGCRTANAIQVDGYRVMTCTHESIFIAESSGGTLGKVRTYKYGGVVAYNHVTGYAEILNKMDECLRFNK